LPKNPRDSIEAGVKTMKNLVLSLSLVLLVLSGCRQQQARAQRFLPLGDNPEIALDSQEGKLCRTVPAARRGQAGLPGAPAPGIKTFSEWKAEQSDQAGIAGAGGKTAEKDPLGLFTSGEPECAVSEVAKKRGFVPESCKSGQTWVKTVKGGTAEDPLGLFAPKQKLTLLDLQDIIRVRDELRKAGDPRAERINRFIQEVEEIEVAPEPLSTFADLPLCSDK
jgi:hypothetical protein